jgi:hypothetical protein
MAQITHPGVRRLPRGPLFTQAGIAASGSAIGAAAIAGLIAGLVMAAVLMAHAALTPLGVWLPVRNISAVWYGVGAYVGGAAVIVAGLLTHVVMSMAWGAVLGLFVGRQRTAGAAAGIGLLYGVAVWAIMTFLVLTWTNRDMYDRVMVHPWWWLGAHLVYGLLIGMLVPPLARSFSGVERDRPATAAEAANAPAIRGTAPPEPDASSLEDTRPLE